MKTQLVTLIFSCLALGMGIHGVYNRKLINNEADYVSSIRMVIFAILALWGLLMMIITGD